MKPSLLIQQTLTTSCITKVRWGTLDQFLNFEPCLLTPVLFEGMLMCPILRVPRNNDRCYDLKTTALFYLENKSFTTHRIIIFSHNVKCLWMQIRYEATSLCLNQYTRFDTRNVTHWHTYVSQYIIYILQIIIENCYQQGIMQTV